MRDPEPIAPVQPIIIVNPVRPNVPIAEKRPEPVTIVQPVQPIYIVSSAKPEVPTTGSPAPVMQQPEALTPVKQKELTPVKPAEPEKFNAKINDPPQNDNFSLNFSPAPTAKKLPKKMQFHGKKGRQRTEAEVTDLLTFVQSRNGAWPNDNYVSDQMRRYYRREYPEYFRKTHKKGSTGKVQAVRPAPIDISARRSGTGT